MSFSCKEINPLGLLGLRELDFIPEHFTKMSIDMNFGSSTVVANSKFKKIHQWINYHLNSRYAIKHNHRLNSDNKLTYIIEIGIEDPKEMLLFSLGCPHIHSK
jgi:hypothetical protein